MTQRRISSIPVPGAAECLRQLAAAGWLRLDPQALAAATGADPEFVAVPSMAVRTEALDIGRASADHIASWLHRLLVSAPLAGATSSSRLVAIHLLAHSDVLHWAEASAEELLLLLGSADSAEVESAVAGLHRMWWLNGPPVFADGRVRVVLGAGAAPFAPVQPPVHAAATPLFPASQVRVRAAALVEDRGPQLAHWVAEYRAAHRHGPTWRELRNAHFPHRDPERMEPEHHEAVRLLLETGWLSGLGRRHGLRPGWRHRESGAVVS
ncbi:hypothetical protein AB0C76_15445 [Kitasatospora sp. NPDC048722]|uniref:hypothetical protein n=1 Tax=Kitasatospora sp. NPDC048722 TaxID=3155639 RepID=UPI0033F5CA20